MSPPPDQAEETGPDQNPGNGFASIFFDELEQAGLRHVCVCPGSRSTPLTVAAVRNPRLRCWSHIDERSAAFFALGLAKAAREPVALICTSGTAAANFHPAVIESHYARVPLLVLTADRPPELREWGAGQTIDQIRLFGPHVRWFAELAPPAEIEGFVRYARALGSRAIAQTCGPPAGPVHLNLPFREPLEPPTEGEGERSGEGRDRVCGRRDGRKEQPYTRVHRAAMEPAPSDVDALEHLARRCGRGVISCGPQDPDSDLALAVVRLGRAAGWPILADPTSQLRRGPHVGDGPLLATSDLFLRDAGFADSHPPELLLRLGATPTSKSFRLWTLRRPPAHVVCLDPDLGWNDPGHLASDVLRSDPTALCLQVARRLEAEDPRRSESPWLHSFLEAEARTSRVLERELAGDDELLEPRAVGEVAAALPEGALLYVSNSMPARDLDSFLPCARRRLRVLCNRGANGIDGMTSSALGAAAAGCGPVVLLTGDLAFLHDLSGLVTAQRNGVGATLVVLNNNGGGIFSFLPIAAQGEAVAFEEHFRTPHGYELGPIATSLGATHTKTASILHLRAALKESLASPGLSVIEVPIDRDRNVAQHRRVAAAVSAALASAADTTPR